MNRRGVLLSTALTVLTAASVSAPVLSQPAPQAASPDDAETPDFSGLWRHQSLPGFEPLASGPTSLKNLSRRNGVSDYNQLVGDHRNPILKPEAAEIVRRNGELSKAGIEFGNPSSRCWPEPLPFIYKAFGMQMLQQKDKITILYDADHQHRVVRMNATHPANVKPSLYGDSVGRWEGDTLVVDTIGQRTDRPYAMVDIYGTPMSETLHVVERYRLIDYEAAQDGLERDAKENQRPPGDIDPNYRGKFLQVYFTVEDPNVFTTPWSATITYRPSPFAWGESVCSENPNRFFEKDTDVPVATTPDF
jgi:hypothetical protein